VAHGLPYWECTADTGRTEHGVLRAVTLNVAVLLWLMGETVRSMDDGTRPYHTIQIQYWTLDGCNQYQIGVWHLMRSDAGMGRKEGWKEGTELQVRTGMVTQDTLHPSVEEVMMETIQ
jgi:hypothetical protein